MPWQFSPLSASPGAQEGFRAGSPPAAELRTPRVAHSIRSPVIGTGADLAGVCPGMARVPVVGWCGGCRRPRPALRSWRVGEALGWAGRAGKQGLVWRLDTAEGSWAVKVPFHQSGEDEVRS